MNENYTLTADRVQDSSSSQPTDVTETTVQPAQHTADRPPTDIAHHKSESPRQPTGISFPTREYIYIYVALLSGIQKPTNFLTSCVPKAFGS